MFRTFLAALTVLVASTAFAAPRNYILDPENSFVGFAWDFGKQEVRGRMPVARADIVIDFDNLPASKVRVAVDASHAEAGFDFATQAMRGPRVLDTAHHPLIEFVSREVRQTGPTTATIEGDFTVRGVTRPGRLDAQIYRQRGTQPGDRSQLTVHLKGVLHRSEFGANGWSDMAGDEVRLFIVADIREKN